MSTPLSCGAEAPQRPARTSRGARLAVFALLALVGLFYLVWPAWLYPAEDAAILFCYSKNLAHTGVISYFPGGPPAEGATDFLWMVLLALFERAGIDSYRAATLLSGLAHVGCAWLVWRLSRGSLWVFAGALLALFLTPAVFAALLGFAAYFFAFFLLLAAYAFLREHALALAVSGLAVCLVRPDGLFFVGPLFAAHLWLARGRRLRALGTLALGCALPGALYFAWRARYFGLPAPLPFYVKSDFDRFLGLFERNSLALNLWTLARLLPLLAVAALGAAALAARERARLVALAVALLLVPALVYSAFASVQNIGLRYQFPLLLVALTLPALVLDGLRRRWLYPAAAALALVLFSPSYLVYCGLALMISEENSPVVARELAAVPGHPRMAITEAGRLAYYSGWEALDLGGLNTAEFALGPVTVEAVAAHHPDLTVLHSSNSSYRVLVRKHESLTPAAGHAWDERVRNAYLAATREPHELVMVPHPRPSFRGSLVLDWAMRTGLVEAEDWIDGYLLCVVAQESPAHAQIVEVLRRNGGVSFDEFLERLQKPLPAEAWAERRRTKER